METTNYLTTGDRVVSIKTGTQYTVTRNQTSRRIANIWVKRDGEDRERVIRWRLIRPVK